MSDEPSGKLPTWVPRPTPKNMITFLITLILVIGEWRYGVMGGYRKLFLTLGTCVAVEIVLSLFLLQRMPFMQSAYVSGVSLSLLLRPQGGLDWPFVVGALLTIGSKYVLRYKERHLWNPSNLGLALLVLLAPSQVALLSHELGNDLLANVVIWSVGLVIASQARVLHITVSYAAFFAVLALLRSAIVGTPILAELAPITGPMYQLLCFFMLTDPRTTVSTRKGRVVTVACIALLEAAFRLANDFELPGAEIVAPAPPIIALFVVGPIALAIDLKRQSRAT